MADASQAPTSPAPRVDLLTQVRELEEAGRFTEAIDVLTAANRRAPNPKFEFRLTRLRHAAFPTTPKVTGLGAWPPPIPDSVPGLDESKPVPEVSPENLTVDALRRGVIGHGALLVPKLLDESRVAS